MAVKFSIATGNFTTGSTWGTVDSGSYLNSETNNTAIGTSYLNSSSFTPGAITISHVAIKLASRVVSPSGTITVAIRNVTDAIDEAEVQRRLEAADDAARTESRRAGATFASVLAAAGV